MRLLDRYIARECLKLLGLALVVFLGIYLVVDAFEKLSKFLEARVGLGLIFSYYLFRLPRIFIEVLPVAVLLACLLSLGNMARHNELVAMKMGQVGTLRIALPCIGVGVLASLAAWGVTEYIAPRTSERALNIERTEVRRLPAHRTTRDSDIWYRAQGNRFVHIGLIETQSGLIRGVSVFELAPDFTLTRRVDAQAARFNGSGWSVQHGYQLTPTGTSVAVNAFEELTLSLGEQPEEFARVARLPEEMTYEQLKAYIEKLERSGVAASRYRVDLYAKVATALVGLIMSVIGVSFGLRTSKMGVMLWVGACIPMGFLYYMLLSLGISFGRSGAIPPFVAAWIPNLVFGLAGIASLWRLRG
jgi:lipopolysaccharide export system permease protein